MSKIIKVPNIGDFKSVEIIEVLVKNGEDIKKGDPLITLESDKSSVEVPSPLSGKILNINVKTGDKVSEGDGISTLDLSLSMVTIGSFLFIWSPGLTKISITSTSLKSPISGTEIFWAITLL